MAIKFNKYNVTNTENGAKARVHYSSGSRTDGRVAVTLYAKDWANDLSKIFTEGYKNATDSMTDYFEQGKVVIFEGEALYPAALARCA